MNGRFDYVKYEPVSVRKQERLKRLCRLLEAEAGGLGDGRAKSLALTKLEEFYMWAGKQIRDDQIEAGGSAEDVPERDNS